MFSYAVYLGMRVSMCRIYLQMCGAASILCLSLLDNYFSYNHLFILFLFIRYHSCSIIGKQFTDIELHWIFRVK